MRPLTALPRTTPIPGYKPFAVGTLVVLALAGCSGSDDRSPASGWRGGALSNADIRHISEESAAPEPVEAALEFVRALQRGRREVAYRALTPASRADIERKAFDRAARRARGWIIVIPQIREARVSGNTASVTMYFQQGPVLSQEDNVVTFRLARRRGDWLLGAGSLDGGR